MSRLIAFLAAGLVASVGASHLHAQGRGGLSHRGSHHGHANQAERHSSYYRGGYGGYRSSSPLTLFGFSFGGVPYGYDYAGYPDPSFLYPYSTDPWARGKFREPDLLDDPYFYDRVPSANRYRAPLRLQPRWSTSMANPIGEASPPGEQELGFSSELDPQQIGRLRQASERLLIALATYGGGEAWIEYLAPGHLVGLAELGDSTELTNLLARYNGVSQNRELMVVTEVDGFVETRNSLAQFLGQ